MPHPKTRKAGLGAHHTTAAKNIPMGKPILVDATGLVLGRLASNVAKRLLKGETIAIVNAEAAVVTGSREHLVTDYKNKRDIGTDRKGPFFPRMPHLMVKRTVRGMLPYQRGNGRAAFRRLRVYIGVPENLKGQPQTIPDARTNAARTMTVGEIAKMLGAKF